MSGFCGNMGSCEALCEVCGKSFTSRKALYKHLRTIHNIDVNLNAAKEKCLICEEMFPSVAALNRHKKTHTPAPKKLSCTECDVFKCSSRKELRDHLECEHGLNMEAREMEFESWEEFVKWKLEMESDEKVLFSKNTGERMNSVKSRMYYVCHRSGSHTSRSLGKRFRTPSTKIDHTCPASLTVTKMSSGKVFVKFYETHTGHNFSLASLHLTSADRAMIAGQIAAGVAEGEILKRVRENVSDGFFRRLHLLEKKDIHNIKRDYRLDDSSAHESDAISVHLWVQQQKLLGEDCSVLFYKAQGEDSDVLSRSDFMLVLMTPFQLEMAIEFVPNKVLIDSTHGTNKYNFHLTTLLTVDEFGVGCPIAFCLSTRLDTTSMEVFIGAVKERAGTIRTKVFMSDDCPTYYNAWSAVMGQCTHRLLCTWHVDKTWRRSLRAKVKDTMLKCNIYKVLKALHFETRKDKFNVMLQNFIQWCSEDEATKEFSRYFSNEYARRPEMWAYCHRAGLGVNTNMYLEAYHKTLKHCYLSSKVNNRMDKCIQALLHRSRDLLYERAIRLAKGGLSSGRIANVIKTHKLSESIKGQNVRSLDSDKWEVMFNGQTYIVAMTDSTCVGCPLSCPKCKVCVHKYLCTCIDFMVKGNFCKHIHAVAIHQTHIVGPLQDRAGQEEALQALAETAAMLPSSVGTTLNWKAALFEKIAVFQSMVEDVSSEDAPVIMASLDKLIEKTRVAISARKENLSPVQTSAPHFPLNEARASANKKGEKQRDFYSVRKTKTKQVGLNNLSAPTHSETVAIEEGLLHGVNINVGNDHSYI